MNDEARMSNVEGMTKHECRKTAYRTVNGVFREEFVAPPKTPSCIWRVWWSDSLFPLFSSVWIFSPRLNFETIFGRFLPAMNLVSPTRDHRVILACIIEIVRFNWINL